MNSEGGRLAKAAAGEAANIHHKGHYNSVKRVIDARAKVYSQTCRNNHE